MADESIGALWEREMSGGRGVFMTGKIELEGKEIEIVAFKNKRKEEGDNKPLWTIKLSRPRDDSARPAARVESKPEPQPEQGALVDDPDETCIF